MRRVIIKGTPPQSWLDKAQRVKQLLDSAPDADARKTIIDSHDHIWRDDQIRNWLLSKFNNKCWYTEAQESVSAYHVDHYRPKGRVSDLLGTESEGYWWLAFQWENYRICGQLINTKKSDVFPLSEGIRALANDIVSLQLETPTLIDPLTQQTRLISFEKEEESCIAVPAAGIDAEEVIRAQNTIEILGLNRLARLNTKRSIFWDACRREIENYKGTAGSAYAYRLIFQTISAQNLRKMISYEAEFSSVVEACIRKSAPESLQSEVFSADPIANS